MITRSKLAAAVFGTVLFMACSDATGPDSGTVTQRLVGKSWRVTAMTVNPGIDFGGGIITDFYSLIPNCDRDNTIRFNANGSLTEDEGATKCDPAYPQTTSTGSWSLNAAQTAITVVTSAGGGVPQVMTIVSLTATAATMTFTESPYTFTITLSAP